jgi:sugar fermentation stimulation protein A
MNDVDFIFETPLLEGTIVKRSSQFIMAVDISGKVINCHCPTTGRVGNIELAGIPCLLSKSKDTARKTPYTVEAISVDLPHMKNKKWIGINQNAVNRYVEHFLKNGSFAGMVGEPVEVLREQKLGMQTFAELNF